MLHLKTKCQNKSWFIATRVEWQGRCLLTVISTHIAELIVFVFSDNLSAENLEISADSGIHGIHFLECMVVEEIQVYDPFVANILTCMAFLFNVTES